EWFPKKERAFATGIFNAGSNVGAIVAPLTVPWIAVHLGWRWAFILTGAIGFLWLLFWLPVYRRPDEHPKVSKAELDHIQSDPPDPPVDPVDRFECGPAQLSRLSDARRDACKPAARTGATGNRSRP